MKRFFKRLIFPKDFFFDNMKIFVIDQLRTIVLFF